MPDTLPAPEHQPVPLVLRRVPDDRLDLAHATAGPVVAPGPQMWWELVDPAAPPDEPPAGVAMTCARPELVTSLETIAADPREHAVVGQLVGELVAALRRTEACWVVVQTGDPELVELLVAEGFGSEGAGQPGGRLVLPL